MSELDGYRKEIDEIDAALIRLFEQRMDVVRKVGRYKKENHLPVLQAGREQAVLRQAVEHLQDKGYAQDAARFMNAAMEISRAAQRRDIEPGEPPVTAAHPLTGAVGFQGVAGSFSEQALVETFGDERERIAYPEFEDVFRALQKKGIDYGVLPIENSSTGAISAVYDLLGSYGFFIVGEHCCRVSQNLVGLPGATLKTIKTVYSHVQGIEQSSTFLNGHREWDLVPYHNTAVSAKMVAESGDLTKAAIASKRAAALYSLSVIAPDINNRQDNMTRFIVIGRTLEPENADKISVVFSIANEAGNLYQTLRTFADNRLNMVKIESRPLPDAAWNYLFYVDFEGNIADDAVRAALEKLSRDSVRYRLLGAYRAAK